MGSHFTNRLLSVMLLMRLGILSISMFPLLEVFPVNDVKRSSVLTGEADHFTQCFWMKLEIVLLDSCLQGKWLGWVNHVVLTPAT